MPDIAYMPHTSATGGRTFPDVAPELTLGAEPTDSLSDEDSPNEIKLFSTYSSEHPLFHVFTTRGVSVRIQKLAYIVRKESKHAHDDFSINLDFSLFRSIFRPSQLETLDRLIWTATPDKTVSAFNWGKLLQQSTPLFRKATVEKFERLAAEWRVTRNNLGSVLDMCSHVAYQQIIGMGKDVVPLILKELEQQIDHWFWALRAITAEDPVAEEHRGRMDLMARDWLNWARIQGYQW